MNRLAKILATSTFLISSFLYGSNPEVPCRNVSQQTYNRVSSIVGERSLQDEIKGYSEEIVSQLPSLYKLRKVSNLHPKSDLMTVGYVDHWCYFIKNGASLEVLSKIPQSKFRPDIPTISSMYEQFNSGEYPIHIIKNFQDNHENYSISIAQKCSDYDKGINWVKSRMKEILNSNSHSYPPFGEGELDSCEVDSLKSDISDIDSLENIGQAFLIYMHMKLLQKQETTDRLYRKINNNPSIEHGGITDFNDSGLQLFLTPQKKFWGKDRGDESIAFSVPDFFPYAMYVGDDHSHIYGTRISNRRHPSPVDLGPTLSRMKEVNKYLTHSLQTDMGMGKVNKDIFYNRIHKDSSGKWVAEESPTVIDVGNFTSSLTISSEYLKYCDIIEEHIGQFDSFEQLLKLKK